MVNLKKKILIIYHFPFADKFKSFSKTLLRYLDLFAKQIKYLKVLEFIISNFTFIYTLLVNLIPVNYRKYVYFLNRVIKYINKIESVYYNLAPALPVLVNIYRIGIVGILELLVLVIYPIIRPSLVVIVSIFYLTYFFHSDSLNLEINSYMCSILYSSIGFFLSLHLILLLIKNGYKLKKSYPLVYKSLIIIIFLISVIFAISFYSNLNALFNEIIILLAKYIGKFIVKMISTKFSAPPPQNSGGFGGPAGGGGSPPPPGPPKYADGHYEEDPRKDAKKKQKEEEQREKNKLSMRKLRSERKAVDPNHRSAEHKLS